MTNDERKQLYIPKGSHRVEHKPTGCEAYLYERAGIPCAAVFRPKAGKPEWQYRFSNAERREKAIIEFFSSVANHQERVKTRRATAKAEPRGLEVGDVVRASWGYDQTNIDYWQVVALIGDRMVELRPIAQHSVETAWAQGDCAPKLDTFTGPAVRKTARSGSVKMAKWGKWAHKITPEVVAGVKVFKTDHWTAYA